MVRRSELQEEILKARQSIRAESLSMSLGEIANNYAKGELVIRPEFQRLFRWKEDQKSRLVESVFLGIPVPSIFVLQRDDGIWEVIDGLQRLSTILEFMGILRDEASGKIEPPSVLTATDYLPSLKGISYSDGTADATNYLTEGQRLTFKRAAIDVKILLPESDTRAKFELFDRLNTGGSPLSAQEVRNAQMIMRSPEFYNWLEALRTNESFQNCIPITGRLYDEAYDMELVCRFFALQLSSERELRDIQNIDSFISKKIFDAIDDESFDRSEKGYLFRRTFNLLSGALGEDAFRRHNGSRFLGAFSVSAFETVGAILGENIDTWEAAEHENPGTVQEKVIKWWQNSRFRSGSGSGIRASTRLYQTIPAARTYFAK